ncbi:hypothetical protein SARC_06733 [Sphaeroforma arctica JP610]|uniref:EGF domain-specific O-linked N-acetylglucosamine transferase n=1 Tax=Sphaeroforma arctica JP610 TaxID=667725 RepID=A0A0L0FVP7_9EUKA|nr:hypothetical protein SARC_06733 [Sphaeroforma arctica JP610]KNC80925.1 hypothetical protein SARC_06733 [Sphaeroforma arctica JP610]|eukprot:XP_014154827.1 hypothetical protein SARC_06733 [Sphaeroforma arctica JP610]
MSSLWRGIPLPVKVLCIVCLSVELWTLSGFQANIYTSDKSLPSQSTASIGGATNSDSQMRSSPSYNDLPTFDPNAPLVQCQLNNDEVMVCVYQTLCFDGGKYYAIVGETDADIPTNLEGMEKFSMRSAGDGEFGRHISETGRLNVFQRLEKQVTPIKNYINMEGKSVEFIKQHISQKGGGISWLPDHSMYFQPAVDNAYLALISVLSWWNIVCDMMNGIDRVTFTGSVFAETQQKCLFQYFGFWYDVMARITSVYYKHDKHAVATSLGISGFGGDDRNQTNITYGGVLDKYNGFLVDVESVWPEEKVQRSSSACRSQRDHTTPKLVCGRQAFTVGRPNVPVTGSVSKQRLRYEVFKLHGEKTVDMQKGIKGSVRVLIVDRGKEGRCWAEPTELRRIAAESVHVDGLQIEVEYIENLGTLSVYEQFAKFARAHVVLMAHGAGAANTYFMNTNSAFIEGIPVGWNSRAFRELYSSGGGYYQSIDAIKTNLTVEASLERQYQTDICQQNHRSWERTHYYQAHGDCYQSFKYWPLKLDEAELKKTLQRAYKHLKYT